MEKYEEVKMEVISLENEGVIVCSNNNDPFTPEL